MKGEIWGDQIGVCFECAVTKPIPTESWLQGLSSEPLIAGIDSFLLLDGSSDPKRGGA